MRLKVVHFDGACAYLAIVSAVAIRPLPRPLGATRAVAFSHARCTDFRRAADAPGDNVTSGQATAIGRYVERNITAITRRSGALG